MQNSFVRYNINTNRIYIICHDFNEWRGETQSFIKHPVIFTNFIQRSLFGVEFFFYFPVLIVPSFSKLYVKLNFSKTHGTLFKLHVQSEHWACCTFCFFHTTVFDYNKKEMQFLFMSLSEIKDGLQVKTCIQVKAMLKTIFFISLPPHHQRDRFPYEKSPEKSPFIAVVYKRPMKVMDPIWRPTRSFEYPINSVFIRNKFMAFCSQSKNK